jgi:hypothetical protein
MVIPASGIALSGETHKLLGQGEMVKFNGNVDRCICFA